jgi:hypothetical protein
MPLAYANLPRHSGEGHEKGFVQTAVSEIAQDFVGAGRTVVGLGGSVAEFLGASVPITVADLTTRDKLGFAMLASMLATGGLPAIMTKMGAPALAIAVAGGGAAAGFARKAAFTAGREAMGGALYGALRTTIDPAEDDYVRNMVGDAAMFGAFGAGFSLAGSGLRGVQRQILFSEATRKTAEAGANALTLRDTALRANEFAGNALRNPETGNVVQLFRDTKTGKVRLRHFVEHPHEAGQLVEIESLIPVEADDYGRMAGKLIKDGFTELKGTLNPAYRSPADLMAQLTPEAQAAFTKAELSTMVQLSEAGKALRDVHLAEYRNIYVGGRWQDDARNSIWTAFADDLAKNVNEYGAPYFPARYSQEEANSIVSMLSGVRKSKAYWFNEDGTIRTSNPMITADIVEEAVRQGVTDPTKLASAASFDDAVRFSAVGFVPQNFLPAANTYTASVLMRLASGSMVARTDPLLPGFLANGTLRIDMHDRLRRFYSGRIERLFNEMPREMTPDEHKLFLRQIDGAADRAAAELSADPKLRFGENKETWSERYKSLSDLIHDSDAYDGNLAGTMAELERLHKAWQDRSRTLASQGIAEALPEFKDFGTGIVDLMDEFLDLGRESGYLALGQPSYFPIFNRGTFFAEVTTRNGGKLGVEALGGFASEKEAVAAIRKKIADNPGAYTGGAYRPGYRLFDKADGFITDKEWSVMAKKEMEGLVRKIGPDGKYITGQRFLGIRDFEDISLRSAMDMYVGMSSRKVAFGRLPKSFLDFTGKPQAELSMFNQDRLRRGKKLVELGEEERAMLAGRIATMPEAATIFEESFFGTVDRTVADIAPGKGAVRAWVRQMGNDVLGVPRESERFMDNMLRAMRIPEGRSRQYLGKLRALENVTKLGGISSSILNVSQFYLNTGTKLGLVHTFKTVSNYLKAPHEFMTKVNAQMREAGVNADFLRSAAPDLNNASIKSALKRVIQKESPSLAGKLNGKAAWEAFQGISMYAFSGTEGWNRRMTFAAALSESQAKNTARTYAEHLAYATDVMYKTQFNYHITDMPEFLRSPLGATIFQFKSFFVKEMEFIAGLSDAELVKFAGLMSAGGGIGALINMPGMELADAAKAQFFDENLTETLKIDGLEAVGIPRDSRLSKMLVFGIGAGTAGVDLSDRIAVGGFWDQMSNWNGPVLSDLWASRRLGPIAASLLTKGELNGQQWTDLINDVIPSEMRRWRTTRTLIGLGDTPGEVHDYRTGKMIYKSGPQLSGLMAQIATPIDLSRERAMNTVVNRVTTRYRERYSTYSKDAAQAYISGDREGGQRLMAEARDRGYNISPRSLNYWIKEMQRPASERRLRRTPAELRNDPDMQAYFEATGDYDSLVR